MEEEDQWTALEVIPIRCRPIVAVFYPTIPARHIVITFPLLTKDNLHTLQERHFLTRVKYRWWCEQGNKASELEVLCFCDDVFFGSNN